MRARISLFFIIVTASAVYSQTKVDSVLAKISALDDSTKTRILLEETWNRRSNDPLTAINLGKEAAAAAKIEGNKTLEAKSNNYLGVIYTNIGAIEMAFEHHQAALKIAKEADDPAQTAYSYNNLGNVYRIRNKIEEATASIQSAIKIFESTNDQQGLAYCYINIGRLYSAQEDFNNALAYFEMADKISIMINNEDMRARILLEIAKLAQNKKDYARAEQSYFELEKLYKKINYLKGFAEVWQGLSDLAYKKKNMNDAMSYSLKALELNKKILNASGEVNNLNDIALICLEQKKIKAGEDYLALALHRSIEINEPTLIADTYYTLYRLHKQTGKTDSALFYFEKYHGMKDSIVTNEEILKLGEMESLVKIERSEKEKQMLLKDLENQTKLRNYLAVIVVLFILIVIMLTIRYYEKKRLSTKLNEINIVKDQFFKIIAHDLREPFAALFGAASLLRDNYDELTEEEKKQTINMIGESIRREFDLLQNLLMWAKSQRQHIKFNPEKLALRQIINENVELIKTNLANKNIFLNVECADDMIINADEQMLNTIIRNLIFNALKFTNEGGEISIAAGRKEGRVKIEIRDNGIGMDNETINNLFALDKKNVGKGTSGETGSGIGLIITKEFVEAHKGTIDAESEPGKGSVFTINLPE